MVNFYELDKLDSYIDRIEIGESNKKTGNQLFADQKYQEALKLYEDAILNLEFDENSKSKNLRLAMHNNMSLIYQKIGEFSKSLERAEQALSVYPNNMKATLRKIRALTELGEYDNAT